MKHADENVSVVINSSLICIPDKARASTHKSEKNAKKKIIASITKLFEFEESLCSQGEQVCQSRLESEKQSSLDSHREECACTCCHFTFRQSYVVKFQIAKYDWKDKIVDKA